jgi:MEDS: MEthanogen/methylotroph, DcmR Sensory domain
MYYPWDKVVEQPHPDGHLVQMYQEGNDGTLIGNVGLYLNEGLRNGDVLLVVANAGHVEAFRKVVDGCGAAESAGRVRFFDSREMLARLMDGGQPDWGRFEGEIGETVAKVRQTNSNAGLRAYGDMVNLLWKERCYSAAIRLEQFWNKLLSRTSFSLFCAYSIDVFGQGFQGTGVEGILATHTHLIPGESNGHLETAIRRAMDEVLGGEAEKIRVRMRARDHRSRALMASGEGLALWLRNHLADRSEAILELARQHYRALQTQ